MSKAGKCKGAAAAGVNSMIAATVPRPVAGAPASWHLAWCCPACPSTHPLVSCLQSSHPSLPPVRALLLRSGLDFHQSGLHCTSQGFTSTSQGFTSTSQGFISTSQGLTTPELLQFTLLVRCTSPVPFSMLIILSVPDVPVR